MSRSPHPPPRMRIYSNEMSCPFLKGWAELSADHSFFFFFKISSGLVVTLNLSSGRWSQKAFKSLLPSAFKGRGGALPVSPCAMADDREGLWSDLYILFHQRSSSGPFSGLTFWVARESLVHCVPLSVNFKT